jgi:adenylosuccinate lyase
MPHKRNPIATENVTGISRLLRGYAAAGMENIALWHERDISHSSVERVAIPDACLVLDFALARMTAVVDGLVVDGDRMASNLGRTRGLVYSQAVLLALLESGHSRDNAYRIVQRNALAAWDEGGTLEERLATDPEMDLDAATLATCFDPARFLRNAGTVFARLDTLLLRTLGS